MEISIRKWVVSTLIVVFLIAMGAVNAKADESANSLTSFLKFSAGVVASYAIHEGGHVISSIATGTELDWKVGTYNQPIIYEEFSESDSAGLLLSSSGLTTQILSSEIILRSDKINKQSSFVKGIMIWNIVNPVLYSLDYWYIRRTNKKTGRSYQGDIEGVEYYSNKSTANGFAFAVSALAIYQGYRFYTHLNNEKKTKENKHTLNVYMDRPDRVMTEYNYRF